MCLSLFSNTVYANETNNEQSKLSVLIKSINHATNEVLDTNQIPAPKKTGANAETELIEDPKSNIDHLVDHDYQKSTKLVGVGDIDTGPKVKRKIIIKLGSAKRSPKKFRK